MQRIAVINQKGGVGKTTTTANLAAAAAEAGRRVLLIDLDPQSHLSLYFGLEVADEQPVVFDVLTEGASLADVVCNVRERLDLAPASIDLAGVELALAATPGREVILREALDKLSDRYDLVLIDCPPSLGVLTVNALVSANEVLIPLQAHFLALQGLGKLLDTVTLVRQRINPQLRVLGVVLCMFESGTRLASEVVEDLTQFLESARGTEHPWADAQVYQPYIRRNIKLAESSSYGQTIFEYAPKSNGALDYADLAQAIFGEFAVDATAEKVTRDDAAEPEEVTNGGTLHRPAIEQDGVDGPVPNGGTSGSVSADVVEEPGSVERMAASPAEGAPSPVRVPPGSRLRAEDVGGSPVARIA
jgi:chromosome partitioning protein